MKKQFLMLFVAILAVGFLTPSCTQSGGEKCISDACDLVDEALELVVDATDMDDAEKRLEPLKEKAEQLQVEAKKYADYELTDADREKLQETVKNAAEKLVEMMKEKGMEKEAVQVPLLVAFVDQHLSKAKTLGELLNAAE